MESDILMPQLRFTQFTEKWSDEFMGNLYPQIRNGFVGTATPYYREIGVKYLQGKNIKFGEINPKGLVYICDEFHQKSVKSQLKINDILMVQSGHVGECAVVCKEYENANCHALVVCTPVKKIDSRFYVYLFYSRYGLKQIYKIKTGNTIQHILASELKKVVVPKVEFEEQQKIADFLSSVDKKISLLKQKHSLLQQYKKGVMQQLFSQQIRFKDENGKTFPDWQELRAKEVFQNHSNKKHDSTLPILAATQDQGIILRSDLNKKIDTTEASVKSYKVVESGDFVSSLRSFQGGIEYSSITGICSPAYTVLKPKIEINEEYFKYYFKKESFISQLSSAVIGIRDGKQISYDAFSGIKLLVPTVKEQNKISNFLNAIDIKINLAAKQIKLTQTFKKGLLQQMFV